MYLRQFPSLSIKIKLLCYVLAFACLVSTLPSHAGKVEISNFFKTRTTFKAVLICDFSVIKILTICKKKKRVFHYAPLPLFTYQEVFSNFENFFIFSLWLEQQLRGPVKQKLDTLLYVRHFERL